MRLNYVDQNALSYHRAHEVLRYEAESGKLYWRVRIGKRKKDAFAGVKMISGYYLVAIDAKRFLMHRLIWFMFYGAWPNGMIDHIDRDPQNNRIENLRVVSTRENTWNSAGWKKRDLPKGVSRTPRGRYVAFINAIDNGKSFKRYLGTFGTVDDAFQAHQQAALNERGEYAPMNYRRDAINHFSRS